MQEIKLQAKKREIVGRKVKNLRGQGLVPANIYGKKTKSLAVSLEKKEFEKVYHEAGETGIVKLTVEGEKEERPILIQNVQLDPVTEDLLHADLRQIILTEKISAKIPVRLVGKAPASEQKIGILIQTVSEIEVEALPTDLPEEFEVDISKLEKAGDEVLVKGLKVDRRKIAIKVTDDLVLAKIEPLAAEEVAPPKPAEAVPVEGEAPVVEGETKSTEGETPSKKEPQKEEKKE